MEAGVWLARDGKTALIKAWLEDLSDLEARKREKGAKEKKRAFIVQKA